MSVWAVLPAAGSGQRMQTRPDAQDHRPKQYLPLQGASVIEHSLTRLLAVANIRQVLVALSPDDRHFQSLPVAADKRVVSVTGGGTRCQSVLNALLQLPDVADVAFSQDDWVLVHDAVRPCVRIEDVQKLLVELKDHPIGGILGAPVAHTLKQVEGTADRDSDSNTGSNTDAAETITATLNRHHCRYAFTPQMFRYSLLREAIETAINRGTTVTDESSAVEALGHRPCIVVGSSDNIKITYESDLHLAAAILQQQESAA